MLTSFVPSFISVMLCLLRCTGVQNNVSHGDTGITILFFTVVKNIDEQWNISLFHRKA